jgi:hypothetical protein
MAMGAQQSGGEGRGRIAARLYAAAETRASANGVRFGEGANHQLRYFSEQAADRILRRAAGEEAQRESFIAEGVAAFEAVVDRMVVARKGIAGYEQRNPGVIGEETLSRALRDLCPLWPIC